MIKRNSPCSILLSFPEYSLRGKQNQLIYGRTKTDLFPQTVLENTLKLKELEDTVSYFIFMFAMHSYLS